MTTHTQVVKTPANTAVPIQRWVRQFDAPPGYWKKQLSTKILGVGRRGKVAELSALLESQPEVLNQRGNHGRTLLWEAARAGKLAAVEWLYERGAHVDLSGCYNNETLVQITPYCAAGYYHRDAIATFLRAIMAPLDIFRLAFTNERRLVNSILDEEPELLNAEDAGDAIYHTPLIAFAVAGGHFDLTVDLLDLGADVAPYSAMLCYLAGKVHRLDLVDVLIAHGADLRAVDAGAIAVACDAADLRYFIKRGMPIDNDNWGGFTPLQYVCRADKGEHADKVQLLLRSGADPNRIGPRGRTALHYAAAGGFADVMALLLHHGAVTKIHDEDGDTPMDLALRSGRPGAVAILGIATS